MLRPGPFRLNSGKDPSHFPAAFRRLSCLGMLSESFNRRLFPEKRKKARNFLRAFVILNLETE